MARGWGYKRDEVKGEKYQAKALNKGKEILKKLKIVVPILLIYFGLIYALMNGWIGNPALQKKGPVVMIAGLFLFASGIIFLSGFRKLKIEQLVKNTPPSNIGSLSMGLVETKGRAKPAKKRLRSPFTGTPCVAYISLFQRLEGSDTDDKARDYVTEFAEMKMPMFYLEDKTGKILIDPYTAKKDIKAVKIYRDKLKDFPKRIRNYLREKNYFSKEKG